MARPAPPRPGTSEGPAEPESEFEEDRNIVQVFYATDRAPHLPPGSKAVEWSLFFPAAAGVIVTLIPTGLAARLRSKIIVPALAVTSFLITLYLGQQLVVRMQQVWRAAEFGDRTYGETRHEEHGRPVLELGVCEVSIPPDHRVGHVESPSILRLEFREDPEKHVVLQRTVRLEADGFYASLKQTVDESPNQQALVFIHGYNVGFDSAVKRTAQIVYDLKFPGAAVCYSWPSNAGIADYTRDEANVGWTVTQLEAFLRERAARSGAKTIHLIAHSMGNRALLAAIERMSLRGDGPQFGQVILAAPDVDAGEFRTRYAPALANTARQVTLYASSNDRALVASTKVHGYTRAGLSGENLMVTPGIETIDVSPIDTSLIGHSYYGDNPQLIRDLVAMIDQNLRAANREWLERDVLEEEEFYWSFRSLE
jgi:esterase/lipase superfamily enzyme